MSVKNKKVTDCKVNTKSVNRLLGACEKMETEAAKRGFVFVPDDGAQADDAMRKALCADIKAQVGHVYTEALALLDLTRNGPVQPEALFHHFRRVTVSAQAGMELLGARL